MKLIVIEGPDGVGKSTTCIELVAELTKRGKKAALFREPGGTMFGESVRALLMKYQHTLSEEATMFLFQAARAELCKYILSIADQLDYCIFDRFYYSTIVYQNNINRGFISWANQIAAQTLLPTKVFLLLGKNKNTDSNEFQIEGEHNEIMQRYIALSQREENWITISVDDADKFQVAQTIANLI